MLKTIIIYIISCIVIASAAFYVGYNKASNNFAVSEPDTITVYETISDTVRVPKLIIKKVKQRVNVDSLFEVAKEYWAEIYKDSLNSNLSYMAVADSTYKDSLLTAHIKYISRLPLDPSGYFDMKFSIRDNTVIKEFRKKSSWWDNRFVIYTGIGFSYPSKAFLPNIQIGVGIRLK